LNKVYRNQKFKDQDLNENPGYNFSISGNPTLGRLDRSMSVNEAVFPIADILEFTIDIVSNATVITTTKTHGLGFIPEILGTYYFESDGLRRILGDTVDPDYDRTGQIWIENVTNTDVVIGHYIDGLPAYDTLHMKLFLLDKYAV